MSLVARIIRQPYNDPMWGNPVNTEVSLADFLAVLEPLAVIIAAAVAAYSVNSWRREYVGRKKIELAGEILEDFYRARDVIVQARHNSSLGDEGSSRPHHEMETEDITRLLDAYYAPAERLLNESELFIRLDGLRYRAMVHFGKESGAPFDMIRIARNRVISAGTWLVRSYRDPRLVSERRRQRLDANIDRWEARIWGGMDDEDEIANDVDAAVEAMEALCRPLLSG